MKVMHGPHKSEHEYCDGIEREEPPSVGPIWVYWLGQENVYFVALRTGIWHYCKCL